MSEPVSKSDVQQLSHEYKKTLKTILEMIFSKIKNPNKKTNGEIEIKVDGDSLYKAKIGQKPTENRLADSDIATIKTALENPRNLKGSVSIFVDKDKIFEARDGKVIKDSLQLTNNLKDSQKSVFKPSSSELAANLKSDSVKEGEGKELVQHANQILDILGTRTYHDNSSTYESNNYIFNQKNQQLSITAKDGKGEIFNNNGFTKIASDEDKLSLGKMEEFVDKLKIDNVLSQLPSCKQATWKMG